MSSTFGGLLSVTLILLRNDRAIFGEEGKEMEEPALSAPEPRGIGDMSEGKERGGKGGRSSAEGEVREPLQCPGLAR